jgi:hypothetical protein
VRRILAPALVAVLACNTGFEPQYRVTDLRILAVRAEVSGSIQADACFDDSVQLAALVANPLGRTGLAVRWFLCAPSPTGALTPCQDPGFLADPDLLVGSSAVELQAGAGTGEQPPAFTLSSLPPDVAAALATDLKAAEDRALAQATYQCSVFVEIPLVVVATAEGRRDVALKHLRLVQRPADVHPPLDGYVVNHDPQPADVFTSPTDPEACTGGNSVTTSSPFPAGRVVICGQHDTPETYYVCGPAGERIPTTEAYTWQWYVTAGNFPDVGGVGNAQGSHLDFERPAGPFTLWAILRDGREGSSWMRFDVSP